MKNKYLIITFWVIVVGISASAAIAIQALDKVHSGNGDYSDIVQRCVIAMAVVAVCLFIGVALLVKNDRELSPDRDALLSLTGMYSALYRIDLKGDRLSVIKGNDSLRCDISDEAGSAKKALASVVSGISSKDYKEEAVDFVNLSTLQERMKGMRTLSYEFVGESLGWCRIRFIAEGNDLESMSYVVCAIEVIDKEKRRARELTDLAELDGLTGIRNSKSGRKHIESNLNSGNAGMLLLANIDKMSGINESFGNEVGDKTLVEVAKSLSTAFRDKDIITRLGGDEFAVYIVGVTDEATGRLAIERFFSGVNAIDIPELKGRAISLSAGAAFYDGAGKISFDDIYGRVYNMVHQSKQISGNYCSYYRENI